MNYLHKAVEEFMKDNELEFNKKFNVEGYEEEFYIDDTYQLWSDGCGVFPHLLDNLLMGKSKIETATLEQLLTNHPTFRGWVVGATGAIQEIKGPCIWRREYKAGNVFETQAEAEKENARRVLNRRLREWKYRNDPEKPKGGEDAMFGVIGHRDPKNKNITLYIDSSKMYPYFSEFGVYFTSADAARLALDAFRKELTEYFNMED